MRCPRRRGGVLALAMLLIAGATGCTDTLSAGIVHAPNNGRPRSIRIAEAVETASVESAGVKIQTYRLEPTTRPRGTVLLLHGYLDDARRPLPLAKLFCRDGFRAVLVDLRGHGGSGGTFISYGATEAGDVSRVLDDLAARHLLAGPVFVWGYSLGAATAVQAAARDERIDSVMAVGAFAAMRTEVPRFGRLFVPMLGWQSDRTYVAAIDAVGKKFGFDPDTASALAALPRIARPVLLIHGRDDWVVTTADATALAAAAPPGSDAIVLPAFGHWDLRDDKAGEVSKMCRAWLDRHASKKPVSPVPVPSPGTPGGLGKGSPARAV